jgi:mannose-6-phosphate isomerase-like protein (cupin superfamily)
MPRTNTTSKPSISVSRPNAQVESVFPSAESNYRPKIVIPEKSGWRTELHWHESYDEYIHINKGRIRVTIGDVKRECGPEDGDLKIPKFTVHEFMRADIDMEGEAKETGNVEILEWSDPGIDSINPSLLEADTIQRMASRGLLPESGLGHDRRCGD